MNSEDGWRFNEDADIKLLCLRLFALLQRTRLSHEQISSVRIAELLPFLGDIDASVKPAENLGQLCVHLPARHVVHAEVLSEPLLPSSLLHVIKGKPLPYAAINKEKTPYADSILLLELLEPAPLACCPADLALGVLADRREYKSIPSEYMKLLAVLIQSKHHEKPDDANGESYKREYLKCLGTPIPFIYVLISDAATVTYQNHIKWPYNGNGYFVGGHDQLQRLLGEFLFGIRSESWLSRK